MEPVFGGILGGIGSIAGALINSSSAQAINTQTLQNQMQMAQGSYLPGLISNAAKAGINPLVAMGVKTPSTPSLAVPQPGTGVSQAASILSENFAHTRKMQQQAEDRGAAEIRQLEAGNTNTSLQIANQAEVNRRILGNPSWIPSGWTDPQLSPLGAVRRMGTDPNVNQFNPWPGETDWQPGGKASSGTAPFNPWGLLPNFNFPSWGDWR